VPRTEVNILRGTTFVVSHGNGDLNDAHLQPLGLFHRDMRHLSQWELRLNGRPMDVLSASTPEHDEAMFVLVEEVQSPDKTRPLTLVRRRHVSGGLVEQLTVHNHALEPVSFELSVLFDADFADIHGVKTVSKHAVVYRGREANRFTLGYRREDLAGKRTSRPRART
jgi:hypothetical protein